MPHITDTENWPSFGEELGRKAMTTLEKWMVKYNEGRISKRELFIMVDALHDTTSGLIPRDDLAAIEAVHTEIRRGRL